MWISVDTDLWAPWHAAATICMYDDARFPRSSDIQTALFIVKKKKCLSSFSYVPVSVKKKIEKNVNCYLKGSFKCVPRAEGVRFLTDYLHVLTSVRALLTGMVKMHRWRSHWNVQDFCGYASNVVYVFFVCLFFIIYHPWSSSWMTFHIKLLSVSRVCFVVTVCVCMSSNRT